MKLIAKRTLSYGTRRLRAGDEFEARERDGRALVAIGRAAPAPPAPKPGDDEDHTDVLRERAEALGIKIDRRWGSERLMSEIAKAQAHS